MRRNLAADARVVVVQQRELFATMLITNIDAANLSLLNDRLT